MEEFAVIVKDYDIKHKSKLSEEIDILFASEIEQKLLKAGVNSNCPYCNSPDKANKDRIGNFQRYRCLNCKKHTLFSFFTQQNRALNQKAQSSQLLNMF